MSSRWLGGVAGVAVTLLLVLPASANAALTGVLSRVDNANPELLDLAVSGPSARSTSFEVWLAQGWYVDSVAPAGYCRTGVPQPTDPVRQGYQETAACDGTGNHIPESLRLVVKSANGEPYPAAGGGLLCQGGTNCGAINGPGPIGGSTGSGGSGSGGGAGAGGSPPALGKGAKSDLRQESRVTILAWVIACGGGRVADLARGGAVERALGEPLLGVLSDRLAVVCERLFTRLNDVDIELEHDPPDSLLHSVALPTPAPRPSGQSCSGGRCRAVGARLDAWLAATGAVSGLHDALATTIDRLSSARAARDSSAVALQRAAVAADAGALAVAVANERSAARELNSILGVDVHVSASDAAAVLGLLRAGELIPSSARRHLIAQGAPIAADARLVFGLVAPRAFGLAQALTDQMPTAGLAAAQQQITLPGLGALFEALRAKLPAALAGKLADALAAAERAGDGTTVQRRALQHFIAVANGAAAGPRAVLVNAAAPLA